MEREFKKLDAAKIAEVKKYAVRRLDKDEISKVAGGGPIIPGGLPYICLLCGGQLDVIANFIEAGPDCGRTEIILVCTCCDYEEYYGNF